MKFLKLSFVLVVAQCLVGCSAEVERKNNLSISKNTNQSLSTDWLVGLWQCEDNDGILYEDWKKLNDTLFLGKSYYLADKDTLFVENIQLTVVGDSLNYSSLKSDTLQKNKLFKGVLTSNNGFQVENPQHGFPKSILYNLLNDTLMMIEISGEIDGLKETQPYQMVKINSKRI
jgi:hypothetical protein